ncbi:MAG: hypothetical protein IJQ49_03045, partial [Prevotella sp.]|nr:hypothetical protein [Prevotella sp.]
PSEEVSVRSTGRPLRSNTVTVSELSIPSICSVRPSRRNFSPAGWCWDGAQEEDEIARGRAVVDVLF